MNHENRNVEQYELGKLVDADESLNPHSREYYNSRTRKIQTDDAIIYLFNYEKDPPHNEDSEEIITWRELQEMKEKKQWNVVRHPLVLNFVNEKLLDRAPFYIVHISAYLLFLLLLSTYTFGKTTSQNVLATIFLIAFGFCLVVKGAIRLRSRKFSKWFIASYLFNIVTYIATFLYIWTPQLFSYDNYHSELKAVILWFLPIVAVFSAWINFLYILRKSPYGIYILMLSRILYSFSQIAIIWVPTLLAFAFAFHLVMSGTEPWEDTEKLGNATIARKLLAILQAITKTSTMMIGEVDADNVLEVKQWVPNVLLIAFEVTTVILLMNLMISLAVGDVNELRHSAQEKLLQIKVNFVIEALQISETCDCIKNISLLHRRRTNNVLSIDSEGYSFTKMKKIDFGDRPKDDASARKAQIVVEAPGYGGRITSTRPESNLFRNNVSPSTSPYSNNEQSPGLGLIAAIENRNVSSNAAFGINNISPTVLQPKVYHIHFPTGERGVRLQKKGISCGRQVEMRLDSATFQLFESVESGISLFDGKLDDVKTTEIGEDLEGPSRKFARWLIGLDWPSLLEL